MTVFRLGNTITTLNRDDITLDDLVAWITGSRTLDGTTDAQEA